jgi:hypothetical protein
MSDNFRYQYGDASPVKSAAVVTDTVIEIGDLVTETPAPAADVTWDTNIATTQEAFHDVFLGVSGQRSRDGDTDSVRVDTRGVFRFPCASATFDIGDFVGPAKASGNALESQKVVGVATANLAIGRVVAQYDSATTEVLVEIVSTIVHGGPQAAA